MKDATGVDFTTVSIGDTRISTVFEANEKYASRHPARVPMMNPKLILAREKNTLP